VHRTETVTMVGHKRSVAAMSTTFKGPMLLSQPVSKNVHTVTCQELFPAFNESFRQRNSFVVVALLPKCVHRHSNPSFLYSCEHDHTHVFMTTITSSV